MYGFEYICTTFWASALKFKQAINRQKIELIRIETSAGRRVSRRLLVSSAFDQFKRVSSPIASKDLLLGLTRSVRESTVKAIGVKDL